MRSISPRGRISHFKCFCAEISDRAARIMNVNSVFLSLISAGYSNVSSFLESWSFMIMGKLKDRFSEDDPILFWVLDNIHGDLLTEFQTEMITNFFCRLFVRRVKLQSPEDISLPILPHSEVTWTVDVYNWKSAYIVGKKLFSRACLSFHNNERVCFYYILHTENGLDYTMLADMWRERGKPHHPGMI